jgi:hypothetical protein
MHLFFIDESGTPPKSGEDRSKYFVLGGIIIPEGVWQRIRDGMQGLKTRRRLRGEMKWRFFAPSNDDDRNPMRGLSQAERDDIRTELFRIMTAEKSVKFLATVVSAPAAYAMASVNSQDDIYHLAYKSITERFQYYLQDLGKTFGRTEYGIVIADHRGRQDDTRLRGQHQKLLHSSGEFISQYRNLVEGLFLAPSHQSVGVQLADLVAGAVWRAYDKDDARWLDLLRPAFRTSPSGAVEGWGIVKVPKAGWR